MTDPDELWAQLPLPEGREFDMGYGDLEPPRGRGYGQRRIVARWANNGNDDDVANFERWLKHEGVVYEDIFATARFWVAVVYE